ncbi:hypothetical protein Nepgr_013205 [Nepenthes gracilis]|uniref:LysM domain-containing protein n=1 Tax=Nepenthes gracilis TaxID=150966 RepID=A0AAD3SIJ9_NEPGR|nr:hypothetical protein Nepgr_013205 [Nepenthes gracilis]
MGCCGEDDDDKLLGPVAGNSTADASSSESEKILRSGSVSCEDTALSPTNSNFSALICKDIVRIILGKLTIVDLARAASVCRLWNSLASDREIQTAAFKAPWKLKDVVGTPSSRSFWRDNGLNKFAISHRLGRGDTVARLAVKYSVQVTDIKRLNNMLSDHGIHSRDRLLIPISNPDLLIDAVCHIELDRYAKREVAVLYLEGVCDLQSESTADRVNSDQGKRRIIESLRRSMRVDDGTAQYYLSISNGDPKAALAEFSDDLGWERQTDMA